MNPSDEEDSATGGPGGQNPPDELAGSPGYDPQQIEMDMDKDSENGNDDNGTYNVSPPPLPPSPPPVADRHLIGTDADEKDDRDSHHRNDDGDDAEYHRNRRDHHDDRGQHRHHHRSSTRNNEDDGDEASSRRDGIVRDADDEDRYSKDSIPDYDKTTNHSTNIIYVTNISQSATLEQMRTLFGFLGDIVDIVMYHYETSPETNFKVCFIKYAQHSSVLMAQHLTNTVFIDRALFVLPYKRLGIPPTKEIAERLGYGESEYVSHLNPGVVTQVATGPGGAQIITTTDPLLASLQLQAYPQLPIHSDPTKIEEIRRTLYIGNLDSSLSPETVIQFFNDIGEVKYIRIAGDDTQPTRFAFVEFTNQASIARALQKNQFILGSRQLKMNHSNNPIVKPPIKLDINDPLKKRDRRSGSREFSSSKYRSSSRHERSRRGYDRRRYDDRRLSPRSGSRRSRSRDRSRRSRSRDYSRRSRSRDELPRRRSRSRDSSRKRKSRSRSGDRKSRRKSSRRR